MTTNLKFDLSAVFETNLLETIAKQSGYCIDDKYTIEYWLMWLTEKDITVNISIIENITDKLKERKQLNYFVKSYKNNNSDPFYKQFSIPLNLCKQEFNNQIMKLCGYYEDRYNNDSLLNYIVDTQLIELPIDVNLNELTRINIDIPIWTNYEINSNEYI